MNAKHLTVGGAVALLLLGAGCALQEVRSKSKGGVEWRRQPARDTSDERYSYEHGFEFKWDKGIGTGLTYRRRDVTRGQGEGEDGVWVDVSFPIWKAKKKDATAQRVELLERKLAALEASNAQLAGMKGQEADHASLPESSTDNGTR